MAQIRGPVGTTVKFTIIRDGKPLDIKIVRDIIQVRKRKTGWTKRAESTISRFYQFTASSEDLFNRAFTRFKNSDSRRLVVDLRGNPGGYLDSAVGIASHFYPEGRRLLQKTLTERGESSSHQPWLQ